MRVAAALLLAAVLAPAAAAAPPPLQVAGNRLVAGGKPVRLLGVDRSGAEYACIQGWGFFDGPVDDASIAAMRSWGIDAVRVPLNEDCWLGLHAKPQYAGAAYRAQVAAYVARLHRAGLYVILDLHWNAPGGGVATGQQPLLDRDHSPAFWRSVARVFRSDRALVLDLYNEPHGVSWRCWRDGCGAWAGMQQAVDAVRAAGGTQPLMLGGLAWSNDLSQWLRFRPRDPLHRLVASFHVYDFNACASAACWQRTVAPVARVVPVVTGELGEDDCASGFVDRYMRWADAHGISYLGWTWDTWDCRSGPALIGSYDGTPTAFGAGFRQHLLSLR